MNRREATSPDRATPHDGRAAQNSTISARLARLSPEERAFVEEQLRAARATRNDGMIPHRGTADDAPLSFEQEVLWRIEQTTSSSAYHVVRAMRLRGPLDVARLRGALDALVERHEALRTRFIERDGRPVARVAPAQPVAFDVVPFVEEPARRDEALERLLRTASTATFELSSDQLLRATLVELGADERVLLIVWHHIASDAGSADILMRDLAAAYSGEALAEPTLRYGDFAAWQRAALGAQRREALLEYWRTHLMGAPPHLALPGSAGQPHSAAFEGARHRALLRPQTRDAVVAFAQNQGTTPYIVLLAATATLLHRYAQADDVVVGAVFTGRDRPELENVVGYFANVLPLRVSFTGDPNFLDVVARVREAHFGAAEHVALPFETLMLGLHEAGAAPPAVQTMFTLLGESATVASFDGVAVEPIALDRKVAKFELTLAAGFESAGLALAVEYRTARFDRPTIERLCTHFETCLEGAVAEPSRSVGTLPLLTLHERRALAEWNRTAPGPATDETLADLFARAATASPDAIAVACGDVRWTFADLDARAERLSAQLRRRGVGADVPVGVCMRREPELLVALLGIVKAGGAYVPIDAAYPPARVAYMLHDSCATLCITQPQFESLLPPNIDAVVLDPSGAAFASGGDAGELARAGDARENVASPAVCAAPAEQRPATAESLAYIIYTSGSTGTPKGAMIRQRGLVNYLRWAVEAYDVRAGIGAPINSSISFDLTVTSLWTPLVAGRTAYLVPDDGVAGLAQVLRSARNFSLVKCTPAHLDALRLEFERDEVAGMCRAFVLGGEALLGESLVWWQARAPATIYVNEYGPTETVVGCAVEFVTGAERIAGPVPIGRPIAGTQLHVLDRNLQPLPVGVAGELCIGGAGVCAGYLGRPELTAERFPADPYGAEPGARMYRSGDLARRLSDGRLEFLGRLDDQVKLRGYRIELGEIEAALAAHAAIARAAVAVRNGTGAGPVLVAYYAQHRGSTVTVDDLRAHLRAALPTYMVPAIFVPLPHIALTPNGKIDRAALPPPDAAESARGSTPYVAPRTALEATLAGCVARVLHRETAGALDDFFELGGHSLSAMRLLGAIATECNVRISLTDFFAAPTVAALAERIAATRGAECAGPAVVVQRNGEVETVAQPADEPAPLTAGQTLLWLQEQAAPNRAVYNVPLTFAVNGELELPALQRALDGLVARQAALRTRFVEIDGTPKQIASEPFTVPFETFDLRSLPEDERLVAAEQCLRRDACAPFDLPGGRLLRATVVRLGEEAWRLAFVAPHIVFDGWSYGVFMRELALEYDGARAGTPPALAALPMTCGDYARWEARVLAGGRLAALVDFWRGQLADAPSSALPFVGRGPRERAADEARASENSDDASSPDDVAGATQTVLLPPELTEPLEGLAQTRKATLFMVLLAAFGALLQRYAGQDDIVVGSPVAGRTRSETEGVIGYFASPLALRLDLAGKPTFDELLERTRGVVVAALDHADIPTEMVVRGFRAGAATPFDAMLVLQDDAAECERLGAAKLTPVPVERGVSAFPLAVTFSRWDGGLRAALRYRKSLIDSAMASRMLAHLRRLLESIVAGPDEAVTRLKMLGSGERAELIGKWNRSAADYPRDATLPELVARSSAARPHATAVVASDGRLTYAELERQSEGVAGALRARGLRVGDLVGVFVDRSCAIASVLLGVHKAGGAYVTLDPNFPVARLASMLADCRPCVVVGDEAQRDVMDDAVRGAAAEAASYAPATYVLGDALPSPPLPAIQSAGVAHSTATDTAYVIYTSGSTGRPKGVPTTHRSLVNFLWSHRYREPSFGASDTLLAVAPFSFDMAVEDLWLPLVSGGAVHLATRDEMTDGTRLAALIEASHATLMIATPTTWRLLLACGWPGAPSLTIISGGEALSADLAAALLERTAAVYNGYGPTETTIASALKRVLPGDPVTLGGPLANTQLYVIGSDGEPAPLGVPGELYIGGDGVSAGYLNRPELSAERFIADPFRNEPGARLYRTGDRARRRADGEIEYLGRLDDQVKLRGFRIELGEIESALRAHPLVEDAVALVSAPAPERAELVAYFVGRKGAPEAEGALSPASLRAYLRGRLPDYMLPGLYVALAALPVTSSGKLDRKALPPPDLDAARSRSAPFAAPGTATETVVASLFRDALSVTAPLGIDDDFFELGGHSLQAMQIVARASTLLRTRLSVRNFFEVPTIRGVAAALASVESAPGRLETIARAVLAVNEMSPAERERRLRTAAPNGVAASPQDEAPHAEAVR